MELTCRATPKFASETQLFLSARWCSALSHLAFPSLPGFTIPYYATCRLPNPIITRSMRTLTPLRSFASFHHHNFTVFSRSELTPTNSLRTHHHRSTQFSSRIINSQSVFTRKYSIRVVNRPASPPPSHKKTFNRQRLARLSHTNIIHTTETNKKTKNNIKHKT